MFITFGIPYEFLVRWHKIKVLQKLPVSYVNLLYLSQNPPACLLKEEAKIRVEQRLKELCSSAVHSCAGTSGSKRTKRLQQVKKLAIHRYEVQDVNQLLSNNHCLEEEKAQLEEQLQTLEARCISVLQQVSELRQDTDRVAELQESFKEMEMMDCKNMYRLLWKGTAANTAIPLIEIKEALMIK